MTLVYPRFAEAIADVDVDELGAAADVAPAVIAAIAAGGLAAPRAVRQPLADALGVPVVELFRAVTKEGGVDLEPALAAAPSRFLTDPATLRAFDAA